MADRLPLLLMTRPRAQSDRFVRQFTDRFGPDFAIATAPVMEIVLYEEPISLAGVGGVMFTSENGVAGLARVTQDRSPHAYCVGDRTASAARAEGFSARSAHGTAEELVKVVAADPPGGRLLHLRGEHARGNIAAALRERGFDADERVVYDQRPLDFDPAVKQAVADAPLTYLPLFSPRSAALVAKQLQGCPGKLAIVSMSAAVTAAWDGPEPAAFVQASYPDGPAMLDGLDTLIAAAHAP
ncbi:uroporphyrinogen-III synthase [Rhodovulum adriaticum]|uniref:Uroporphyrinogen-III synthase n=1 Tax=Rhodovulum adriaticum TaxID=35804 RepID=A0A4R2NZ26_RHOAD|nr:uroporphyrinogen-III synthase [Rhodovulum adriaticum]MBK1634851.1 hypothetical protein [Rhodovulum adriaticum]TCP27569.1 uroporphyrinogen-III synthase [Rhodovulum adriaticum]